MYYSLEIGFLLKECEVTKEVFQKRCDNFTTCFFYNRIFFSLAFFLFFEDVKRVKIFDMSPFTQQTQKGDEEKPNIVY